MAVRGWWFVKAHGYLDRAGGLENTAVLLGSARSGTTWLGELIDRHHDHHVVFEPFWPDRVPAMAAFRDRPYLRPGHADPELATAARRVLLGEVRDPWADHTTRALVARRRLVKEVRANCLAGWLARQLPEARLVLLVRHPLAVVASRLELGWPDRLAAYLRAPELVADHAAGQADWLASLPDPVSRGVAQWAFETAVPLRQLDPAQVRAVHYEALDADPLEIAGPVLTWLGQEVDDALVEAVGRRSRTSRRAAGTGSPTPYERVLASLTPDQAEACERVLDTFGLRPLYDLDRLDPRAGALEALLAADG